jgi:hypothetical protein
MQAPDPIEAVLARLMPPALGQNSQFEIDSMIDELAGSRVPERGSIVSLRWLIRTLAAGGIAASFGALYAVFPLVGSSPDSRVTIYPPRETLSGLVLVSESDRIESMTDEGWQEDPDGSAMHALRLIAVEENSVRDEESGMVVQISEPREEILLTPITAF